MNTKRTPTAADVLTAFVTAAANAPDRVARHKVLAEQMPSGAAFDGIARLSRDDPGFVAGELARFGAIEGMSRHVGDLDRRLRQRLKDLARSPALRVVSDEGEPIDELELPGGMSAPPGYLVSGAGVFRMVPAIDGGMIPKPLTNRPIILTHILVDAETSKLSMEVSWIAKGPRAAKWKSEVVPRRTVMDARAIMELTDDGAPVTSANARDLATYLSEWEDHNATIIGRAWTSRRMGWVGPDRFLRGKTLHECRQGSAAVIFAGRDGSEALAERHKAGGTWEGWLAVMAEIGSAPSAYAAIYAACSAPLLRVVGGDSFIVDWSAKTSQGKTTSLFVGASVWGPPSDNGLISRWGGTETSLERNAYFGCDLPMFLDETNSIPDHKRSTLADAIYMLTNGRGKERGTIEGLKKVATWRTVVLSTGETTITDYSQQGGTRARVLTLTGSPLGRRGAELAERLVAGTSRHHGHLGPRLIDFLVRADHEVIAERYADHLAHYSKPEVVPNRIARRLAKYVSVMAVAADIIHDHLGVPRPQADPITEVWRLVCETSADADRGSDALRVAYEAAVSRQASFWGRGDDRHEPNGGWLGAWDAGEGWTSIGWLPSRLSEVLTRAGFNPNSILSDWKSRGWIRATDGNTWHRSVAGERLRCVDIQRKALAEIGQERAPADFFGGGR